MNEMHKSPLDMIPSFIGKFTSDERQRCMGVEYSRRSDIPQRYGVGDPCIETEPDQWHTGLTRKHRRPTEKISTEQGAVLLPFGETYHPEYYNPSTNALDSVPFLGSRMRYLSDRYFK